MIWGFRSGRIERGFRTVLVLHFQILSRLGLVRRTGGGLAKEIAGGRVVAGTGVGRSEPETTGGPRFALRQLRGIQRRIPTRPTPSVSRRTTGAKKLPSNPHHGCNENKGFASIEVTSRASTTIFGFVLPPHCTRHRRVPVETPPFATKETTIYTARL